MKKLFIKNVSLWKPGGKKAAKTSILLENGKIISIGDQVRKADKTIDAEGWHLSAGWLDIRANFQDPGFEYREDIESGAEAAEYGGFTEVALLPETLPPVSTKAQLEYLYSRSAAHPVGLLPLASISRNNDQPELVEMFDLAEAGAYGFSSGYHNVEDKGFLLRAMLYASQLKKPLFLLPQSSAVTGKAMVHEGTVNVSLGLKGIPSLAEEIEIASLLGLCQYSGAPVHFSCVSTAKGMEQILKARKEGLPVTADVSIHHLCFSEEDVDGFNTLFKLRPPLRSIADRDFLRLAVAENDFIAVCTDHNPQEEDRKKCEFEQAAYGATGLQTCFSQLLSVYGSSKLPLILDILVVRSRKILGIPIPQMEEGADANLTLFDAKETWVLDESTNKSKSRNSPLWKQRVTGRVKAISNKGHFRLLE